MNSWVVAYLWLIPAAPFAASLVILSLSNARRKSAAALAVAGQALALAMSTVAFALSMQAPGFRAVQNFTWFTFGEQALRLGFVLDPLAAAMLVMILLVGLCIFVFSIGYMAEDMNFVRFFAYLSFFSGAMLGLVIANSLVLLFIFWELVGLASYLLIGFWIERPSAAAAAKKAFVTTRIGDMGFFLGMLWLYNRSGTLLFYDGGNGCLESAGLAMLGARPAVGHQTHPGVFDHVATWSDDGFVRRWRRCGWHNASARPRFFQSALISWLWLCNSRVPWRTRHSQNGRPAAAHARHVRDVRNRDDGAQWRPVLFFRRLDKGRNSSCDGALAAIACDILPDAGGSRSHRALHDAANHLRLFRELTLCIRARPRKPASNDDASDRARDLRDFL